VVEGFTLAAAAYISNLVTKQQIEHAGGHQVGHQVAELVQNAADADLSKTTTETAAEVGRALQGAAPDIGGGAAGAGEAGVTTAVGAAASSGLLAGLVGVAAKAAGAFASFALTPSTLGESQNWPPPNPPQPLPFPIPWSVNWPNH